MSGTDKSETKTNLYPSLGFSSVSTLPPGLLANESFLFVSDCERVLIAHNWDETLAKDRCHIIPKSNILLSPSVFAICVSIIFPLGGYPAIDQLALK